MSDFRTKFLGLAVLATTFAGMSYGAVACGANVATAVNAGYLERIEGETDLVSDVTLTCGASALTLGVTVTVSSSLAITSKSIAPANTFNANGNSEVVLSVTDNGAVTTAFYSGSVAGTLVTFTNVTFPANFTMVVRNVRVNASLSSVGSAVTESLIIGQNGLAEFAQTGIPVGQVLRGLQAPTLLPVGGPSPTLSPVTIPVCTGDAIGGAAPPIAFTVAVAEGFPGAFKYQADPTLPNPVLTNQENGSFVNTVTGIGVASSPTQISLTFANLPSTATVYVPLTISYTPTLGTLTTLTLATTQTAATSPSGLTLIPSSQTLGGLTYALGTAGAVVGALPAPVAGVVTAVYTVTATNANQSETFNIPVYLNVPAASTATPLAVQGPITVLESLAPSGALPTSGQASSTPLFATTTNSPLAAQSVISCNTTLLFPFVTNGGGFETGIAVANTTTDNLGAVSTSVPLGKSLATPSVGTCTFNFYGAGTSQITFTTPPIGVTNSTVTPPVAGPVYANILSAMGPSGAGPTNFAGYAIAQCNFLEAHGFSYIVDNFATANGTAEGYLAVVIDNKRGEGSIGIAPFTAQ